MGDAADHLTDSMLYAKAMHLRGECDGPCEWCDEESQKIRGRLEQAGSEVCPVHGRLLRATSTQYGLRYECPTDGCTVVCWGGSTSTPADYETRQARRRCHAAFDELWKPGGRFRSRTAAYRWLARAMNLPVSQAHIGMFNKDQCEHLLRLLA